MRTSILASALAFFILSAEAQIVEPGGRLTIGYYGDAKPFSYENESGKPVGYAVEVCRKVVETAKAEAGLADERISWLRVTAENRLRLLREGKIRVLCGEAVTLSAGKQVVFSIPIFQNGVGALVRSDAPPELISALTGQLGAARSLTDQSFAVVGGTPTEKVAEEALAKLQLPARVTRVPAYAQGVQSVLDRSAVAFFADQSVLRDAVRRNPSFADLKVLDHRYTTAPVAIALRRGNDNARLAVDRALSRLYRSPEFRDLYKEWFGEPDADTAAFFRLSVLPE